MHTRSSTFAQGQNSLVPFEGLQIMLVLNDLRLTCLRLLACSCERCKQFSGGWKNPSSLEPYEGSIGRPVTPNMGLAR